MRILFVVLGYMALALGLVGIAVPLLPTTPLLLLSSCLFLKGSPRLHARLLAMPRVGAYIRQFEATRAIPLRAKVLAVVMMSASFVFLIVCVAESWWLRLVLALAAVAVGWHILSYKTALYNDYSSYMRRVFGCKVQKVSVDASFTCPNRDGTVGWGGCTYCNNASFSPSYCRRERSVACQVRDGVAFFARKYPQMKYLAYFQSYTSTYGRLDDLMRKYEEALSVDGVVGIVIGTRPDCMPDVLLSYLSRLSRQTYVMVEYGIESTDDAMLRHINRGHDFAVVRDAVARTAGAGVAVGGHIILGLPGDTAESIMRQPAILSGLPLTTLKLHQLQIIRGTRMAAEYAAAPGRFALFDVDDYVDVVVAYIERLRPSMVLDRFVSQSPRELLVAPDWGLKNYEFVEKVKKRLEAQQTYQGRLYRD